LSKDEPTASARLPASKSGYDGSIARTLVRKADTVSAAERVVRMNSVNPAGRPPWNSW
jgi:hypothetical protein